MFALRLWVLGLVLTFGAMAARHDGAFTAMADEEDCGLEAGDPAFIAPDGRDVRSLAEPETPVRNSSVPLTFPLEPGGNEVLAGSLSLDLNAALEAEVPPTVLAFGVLSLATGTLLLVKRSRCEKGMR